MTDQTPLDTAHVAMQVNEQDSAARLAFYGCLAEAELLLLLEAEPKAGSLTPRLFPLEGQEFAMVFDTDERLSRFADPADKTVPYAVISGRALVGMLVGKNVGLGLNLGVAPSGFLMPATTIDWLSELLSQSADVVAKRPLQVHAPVELSIALRDALTRKLSLGQRLAGAAYLVHAEFDGGTAGQMLAIIDVIPGAEQALAQAIRDAVIFGDQSARGVDVAFFSGSDPIAQRVSQVGHRFDLPVVQDRVHTPKAPGMDPENPPRL